MSSAGNVVANGRRNVGNLVVSFGLIGVLFLVVVGVSVVAPAFLSIDNIANTVRSASVAGLMFLGLTWVFAVGEIDVSFVAIAALTNMIAAGLVAGGHASWDVALLVGFAAGIVFGIVNGVLIAYLGLPSLVTTIAVGGIAGAFANSIGEGYSIAIPAAEHLKFITETTLGPIPLLAPVCGAAFLVAWYVQERLTIGHYIYAIAENREAVVEAGVPVKKIVCLLFVFSAMCASLGGVLLTLELTSGQPSIAASFFLEGLTAVLLGGAMLKLGKPNVIGTLVSVLILATLVRGGALLGLQDSWLQIFKGVLLISGVMTIIWINHKSKQ